MPWLPTLRAVVLRRSGTAPPLTGVGLVAASGADGRSRTGTPLGTAPSRQRVYQFHHIRMESFVAGDRRRVPLRA